MLDQKTLLEIGRNNPAEAHRLVARMAGEQGHRAFFEYRGRQDCARKAQSRPLPGASMKAFTSGPIKAADKIVNRVVPAHFAILQALGSPLLAMIEEATSTKEKKSDTDFSPQEQWDLCYVFTEAPESVYTLLESQGAKSVRSAAKNAVGMKWEAAAINMVMMAILEQVKRHIETTVRFAADMANEGQVSFFREPPANPMMEPALAGS